MKENDMKRKNKTKAPVKKSARRAPKAKPRHYRKRVTLRVPRERVFHALTTLDGLRGWWTARVSGAAGAGGEVRFNFAGLDEYIVMRVDAAQAPSRVRWSCVVHTGLNEWNGTQLNFNLSARTPTRCTLDFEHVGLTPKLVCYADCKLGWDHFLASLAAYVEHGQGMPYGA